MICAIVVLYETKLEEYKNILSYYNQVDFVYILDNSKESHEDIILKLLSKKYNYRYIHFPENIGLCKALNYGMKMAKKNQFEWALLMDSDSYVKNDIIALYKDFLKKREDNKIAVLSPVHLFDRSNNKKYEGFKEIKWAMTSGCLYNVNIFKKIDGFMEELYVDGLDIDYGYKAIREGYKLYEIGEALIQHFPGETKEVKIGGKVLFKYGSSSPWRYYMQARALVWLILKYKSLYCLIMYFYKWIKVILFFNEKKIYIKELIKGSVEGKRLWLNKR